MPSKLTGLFKALGWGDFPGTPDPNKPNLDAFTSAAFSFTQQPNFGPVPGAPKQGQLIDNVTLNVTMNSDKSWCRTASISSKGGTYSADLLKHEQGHYNLVALTARDLFIEVMQLKGQQFAVLADALSQLKAILDRYAGRTDKISVAYDAKTQTDHGNNSANQTKWNNMFDRAFTEQRTPMVTAPDGATYKIPLLDVLTQGGITI